MNLKIKNFKKLPENYRYMLHLQSDYEVMLQEKNDEINTLVYIYPFHI